MADFEKPLYLVLRRFRRPYSRLGRGGGQAVQRSSAVVALADRPDLFRPRQSRYHLQLAAGSWSRNLSELPAGRLARAGRRAGADFWLVCDALAAHAR